MVQKMGGAASMLSMMPGMGGITKKQIKAAEVRTKKYEAFIKW
jgi:signal recognition particle GTPase